MPVFTQNSAVCNISQYALNRGGVFIGFVGGNYINNQTKCIVECGEGHKWDSASYANLINKKSWCPKCYGNQKLNSKESKINITKYAESRGGKFTGFDGKFKDNVTVCIMECSEGHEWKSRYGNLINSKSWCPSCAPGGYNQELPGILYILESSDAMKIGITNNIDKRLKMLMRVTPFEFKLKYIFEHIDGKIIKFMEKKAHDICVSKKFKGFDGATEWFEYNDSAINFLCHNLE